MLTVLLGGDIIIDRPAPKDIFAGLSELRAEADVFFANLEAPMTDRTERLRWKSGPDERYWDEERGRRSPVEMRIRPEAASELSLLSAVTLANNHMMDYGAEGLRDTLEALERVGIGYSGAGRSWTEATRPCIVGSEDARVALLSYTSLFTDGWGASAADPGLAIVKVHTAYEPSRRLPAARTIVHTWIDDSVLESVARDVASAQEQADVVVVGFHWGQSRSGGEHYESQLADYQFQLARAAIDAGATIVKGVHPHFIGPMEVYKGCPIFYSIGHLLFDTLPNVRTHEQFSYIHGPASVVAKCVIEDGRVVRVEVTPLSPDHDNNPAPQVGDEGEAIARLILESRRPPALSGPVPALPGARGLSGAWDGSTLFIELNGA